MCMRSVWWTRPRQPCSLRRSLTRTELNVTRSVDRSADECYDVSLSAAHGCACSGPSDLHTSIAVPHARYQMSLFHTFHSCVAVTTGPA